MARRTDIGDEELTRRLQRVVGLLNRLLRRGDPSVIGPGAMSALSTLATDGPMRPSDLATREGVRPPTMTRIVTGLEDSGYVQRTVDPADRRASLLAVTPLGNELVLATRSARAGHLARHLARLSPDDRGALAAALPVLETLTQTVTE
jgi:DNA-binding MarR family transcriptional regulator